MFDHKVHRGLHKEHNVSINNIVLFVPFLCAPLWLTRLNAKRSQNMENYVAKI